MPIHRVIHIIDGQPTFDAPLNLILAECEVGGAVKILSPLEYHTDRQRAWYKGVCLRTLSDWNGDSIAEWDARLKAWCGGDDLLNLDVIYIGRGFKPWNRRTIIGVSKKNMTTFIENILAKAIEKEWPLPPPDPELGT